MVLLVSNMAMVVRFLGVTTGGGVRELILGQHCVLAHTVGLALLRLSSFLPAETPRHRICLSNARAAWLVGKPSKSCIELETRTPAS